MSKGAKYDDDKLPWLLLPQSLLRGVVRVLQFGAAKYRAFSWQSVPAGRERYLCAAYRHLEAYTAGEEFDAESGLPHLDHAITNLLFARSPHWDSTTTLPNQERFAAYLESTKTAPREKPSA